MIWHFSMKQLPVTPWHSGYHYCTTSFKQAGTQVLHSFKPCLWCARDSQWQGSLKMVTAENKAFISQPYHKNKSLLSSKVHKKYVRVIHIWHCFNTLFVVNRPLLMSQKYKYMPVCKYNMSKMLTLKIEIYCCN